MFRKIISLCLLFTLLLPGLQSALGETEESFSFQGMVWGMTKDELRSLREDEPFQEPVAQTGHSALVYREALEDSFCIIQYNFLPSGALYNIQIMAPDAERTFYQAQKETYTDLYGSPLTEDDASLETENAVAVMMAFLMRSASDTDYLGWQADDETVIIISREPVYKVCYVEIRRYTDYFRFE